MILCLPCIRRPLGANPCSLALVYLITSSPVPVSLKMPAVVVFPAPAAVGDFRLPPAPSHPYWVVHRPAALRAQSLGLPLDAISARLEPLPAVRRAEFPPGVVGGKRPATFNALPHWHIYHLWLIILHGCFNSCTEKRIAAGNGRLRGENNRTEMTPPFRLAPEGGRLRHRTMEWMIWCSRKISSGIILPKGFRSCP